MALLLPPRAERHLTSCLNFGSVLHNPHLGLMDTLNKLYALAKNVADCVVPQGNYVCHWNCTVPAFSYHAACRLIYSVLEYGTTIPEKRSVGAKICHGLLEKIKFDLAVARTDYAVEPMRLVVSRNAYISHHEMAISRILFAHCETCSVPF
jgi:hypothetical protein